MADPKSREGLAAAKPDSGAPVTIHQSVPGAIGVNHGPVTIEGDENSYNGITAIIWGWLRTTAWKWFNSNLVSVCVSVAMLAAGILCGLKLGNSDDVAGACERAKIEQRKTDEDETDAMKTELNSVKGYNREWQSRCQELERRLTSAVNQKDAVLAKSKTMYADFAKQRFDERVALGRRYAKIQQDVRSSRESWNQVIGGENASQFDETFRKLAALWIQSLDLLDASIIREWNSEIEARRSTDAEIARKYAEASSSAAQ